MGSLARALFAPARAAGTDLLTGEPGENGWTSYGSLRNLILTALNAAQTTATGRRVSADDAVTLPTVYRALFLLASLPAYLPLKLFRARPGGGSDPAKDHHAYRALYAAPNPWQTSYQWRVAMFYSALVRGDGYSSLVYDAAGRLEAIHWLHPDRVQVYIDNDGYPVYKVWSHPLRTDDKDAVWLSRHEMHHFWIESSNGYTGTSALDRCRESVALALGLRETSERIMANGARPSGLLTLPTADKAALDAAKLQWEQAHKGLGKAGSTIALPVDATYTQLSMSMTDAQAVEQARFSKEEMATMLGVPPDFLNISGGQMGGVTGVEQRFLSFLTTRLDPMLVAHEQAIQRDILDPEDLDVVYPRYIRQALLRTDMLTRYRVYAIARQWGLKNADECRALEDENPIGGEAGTAYLSPVNMDQQGPDVADNNQDDQNRDRSPAADNDAIDRVAYRQVFEQTLARVYRRAVQDLPSARRRDALTDWQTNHRLYLADQLGPVVAVLPPGLVVGAPDILTPASAAGLDPNAHAATVAARLLGLEEE